jgi:hypothetical protein
MDKQVPYIVFEGEQARHERTVRRLVIALLISIALIFASNVAWLWFFNQFDFESDHVTLNSQEEGNASYMGGNGVIDNGRAERQDN